MEINGNTKVMGIFGSPVNHSLSPYIHNFIAQRLGDNILYTAFDVTASDFAAAVTGARALGIIGFNVTAPHKAQAAQLAVSMDATASRAAAVNLMKLTAHGYAGYNTDIYGVCMAFKYHGIDVANKTIALVGAGGSAGAAAAAMAQMGAKKIFIINRTFSKAEFLANNLGMYYNINTEICEIDKPAAQAADILILATTPNFLPTGINHFNTIFDVNYHPPGRTGLAQTFGGPEMLIFQAVQTYEIILGVTVPDKIIDEILKNVMGRLLC